MEINDGHHNRTIGILICKGGDESITKYLNKDNRKVITYQ